jgi:hypothetical protein
VKEERKDDNDFFAKEMFMLVGGRSQTSYELLTVIRTAAMSYCITVLNVISYLYAVKLLLILRLS